MPYELTLFVVESDRINAEALPAGYIYLSRKAVADHGGLKMRGTGCTGRQQAPRD